MTTSHIWDYPPYPYLDQVALHCPNSVHLYMELWKQRDKNNCFKIYKNEIPNQTLLEKEKFFRRLRPLCREGLINIDEDPKVVKIEFVGWSDELED